MNGFTVFAIFALISVTYAFQMPQVRFEPQPQIRQQPQWVRVPVKAGEWDRPQMIKEQVLRELKRQQEERQRQDVVRRGEPDVCAGKPEKLCWTLAKKLCGFTNRFGLCRKLYVRFCKAPMAVADQRCRAVTSDRCQGAQGEARAVCQRVCGNQCVEQARCGGDVPEPVPVEPEPQPHCAARPHGVCKNLAKRACGVTNLFGVCREKFILFCKDPKKVKSCHNRGKAVCARAGNDKQYKQCYRVVKAQCDKQQRCPGPVAEPAPREEPAPEVPTVCVQRNKKICWKLAQKACGVTNKYGLCRNVFTKFCMKPKPVPGKICDRVAKGRCGKPTGSVWDRCVSIAKKQCRSQTVCIAATRPPVPEPEEEPKPDALCVKKERKVCWKIAKKVCGVTNKFGVCRDVFTAACVAPQAREDCGAWSQTECAEADTERARGVCRKAAMKICRKHAECGEPEPVPPFVQPHCRARKADVCMKFARDRRVCGATNKFGWCRKIFVEECTRPTPRADCDAHSTERCRGAGNEFAFVRCKAVIKAYCKRVQDCGEPVPTVAPEPRKPKFCVARPRWACEKESKLRQICSVTNKFGVCRQCWVDFCLKPEPQADCGGYANRVCEAAGNQTSMERCVNTVFARCELFNKECRPATTPAPTTIVDPPRTTTTQAPPETKVQTTLAEDTPTPEEEEEEKEDEERDEEEEKDQEEREEEEEEEEAFEEEEDPEPKPEPEPEEEWEPKDFWDCWTYCDGRDGGRDIDLKECKFPGDLLTHASTTAATTAETTAATTAETTVATTAATTAETTVATTAATTAATTVATTAATTAETTVATTAATTVETTVATTAATIVATTAETTTPAAPEEPCPDNMREIAEFDVNKGKYVRKDGEDVGVTDKSNERKVCWTKENIDCLVLTTSTEAVVVETPNVQCQDSPFKPELKNVKFCVARKTEPAATTTPAATEPATTVPGMGCETAFGKSQASECFLEMDLDGNNKPDFNRWGWTNGPFQAGESHDFPIYAGAGQCDTGKGTLVGQLRVNLETAGEAAVTFALNDGFKMQETHLYVGTEKLVRNNNKFTVAPGQYPHAHGTLGGIAEDTFTVQLENDEPVYVVAHAVVCGEGGDKNTPPAVA